MLNPNLTDEDLMALYQEGSEDAFKELYSRHSGKVFGYLRARTRSAEEATDLFQEVFVKIHRSKHLYNRSLPLIPWVFSVTHSVLVDGHRSHKRKNEILDYNFDQIKSEPAQETSATALQPLLANLPKNQARALQMRYLDEKTFEEIAKTLKTSPINVRQIVSRGIKNLKRLMNKDKGDKQ